MTHYQSSTVQQMAGSSGEIYMYRISAILKYVNISKYRCCTTHYNTLNKRPIRVYMLSCLVFGSNIYKSN